MDFENVLCESHEGITTIFVDRPSKLNALNTATIKELHEAKACRAALQAKGIDDLHRQWLARLVSTRRIVVTPTTNALGYFRDERREDGINPNRDFPYDLEDFSLCMQTIAARTLNEIFQEHVSSIQKCRCFVCTTSCS